MLSTKQILRLVLGFSLGLSFVGCLGLPHRRPPRETGVVAQQDPKTASPSTRTTIPADPTPVTDFTPDPPAHPITPRGASAAPLSSPIRTTPLPTEPMPVPPAPPAQPTPVPQSTPPSPPASTPQAPTLAAPTSNPLPRDTVSPASASPTTPTTPPAPSPTPPSTPPAAPEGMEAMRALHRRAAEVAAGMDSYIVRLTRREFIKGKLQPEEVMLLKFRRDPFSVHFKWLGAQARGREVVFVKGQSNDQIHTLLAAGDMPLMPAGKRISLGHDSPLVRSGCRHSILDAGIGHLVEELGRLLTALEKGDRQRGTLTYLPSQKRPEFSAPVAAIERVIPPNVETCLPRGGKRWLYFDPTSKLPLLVVAVDDRGQEVEYYHYDRLQYPVKLDDDDFNPDKLWEPR